MGLIALLVATAGVLVFWLSDAQLKWKLIATAALGASLAMQFVPTLGVHWLVPRLIQVIIAIWMLLAHRVGGSVAVRADAIASGSTSVTSARRTDAPPRPWVVPLLAVGLVAAIGGVVWQVRAQAQVDEICLSLGDMLCERLLECGAFIDAGQGIKWTELHCQRLRQDTAWCSEQLVTVDRAQLDACYEDFTGMSCHDLCLGDGGNSCDALFGGLDPESPKLQCDYPYQRPRG